MKIILNFNYRGHELKKTVKKGNQYLVAYLENTETGEPFRFFCFNSSVFHNFDNLKRDTNYDFIFRISEMSIFLEGVEC